MKKIIGGILLAFFLGIGIMLLYLNWGLQEGGNVEIGDVDFSILADGVYEGAFEGGRWSNRSALTVENGRVVEIRILQAVQMDVPEVKETLVRRVLEAQSLDVEVVSGATVTSKAYLKAMEKAIKP